MMKFLFLFIFFMLLMAHIEHPLLYSLFLVLYSLVVGVFLAYHLSLWAMNSVILIFLGGMMVIFLYISTLSNEDKIYTPDSLFSGLGFGMVLLVEEVALGESTPVYRAMGSDLGLMYKTTGWGVTVFLIFYLLFTLFSVVKLAESFKGAFIKLS